MTGTAERLGKSTDAADAEIPDVCYRARSQTYRKTRKGYGGQHVTLLLLLLLAAAAAAVVVVVVA